MFLQLSLEAFYLQYNTVDWTITNNPAVYNRAISSVTQNTDNLLIEL